MKKQLLLLGVSFSVFASAQETNIKALEELSQKFNAEYIQNQEYIEQLAAKRGVPAEKLKKDIVGKYGSVLVHIDELDMEQILAGNVDLVQNNTLPGVAVTGEGMIAYQWDGGRAIETNQEFNGRLTNLETEDVSHSDHATGVAGVIIASGINPTAKGMAPEAEVMAYDFNNNFNEMAGASQENTVYMLSNHSYGYQAGWRWGDYDDTIGDGWYWFGYPAFNENESVLHGMYSVLDGYNDLIARQAPNHLIVKAAGNDRNSGPQFAVPHAVLNADDEWEISEIYRPVNCGTTGFDCIPYGSVSKNILVVGSIDPISGNGRYTGPTSVTASSFSAFGPTDDGRIKPDLVTQGSDVLIAVGENNYYRSNGTSLAAPSVTGIALLMQQLYNQLNDSYLNSSALKALLLNTTNEAGDNPGPDYRFGFGLVDAFQAANLIVDEQENEAVIYTGIKENSDISIPLIANGNGTIRATLTWLDIEPNVDTIAFELNNRMPVLVNDLDLRLTHTPSGTTYMPWTLDVENPSAAAVPGDNIVDNVEQILIDAPAAGNYTLTVSHKNNLRGLGQNFAIVVSGAGLYTTATNDVVADEIAIYPNPVKDVLNFKGLTSDAEIRVINMDGRIAMNQKITSESLNVSSLPVGSYILIITTEEGTVAKKFIKK